MSTLSPASIADVLAVTAKLPTARNRTVEQLDALIEALLCARHDAQRGDLFCSVLGRIATERAYDLFEADDLHDLSIQVAQDAGEYRDERDDRCVTVAWPNGYREFVTERAA